MSAESETKARDPNELQLVATPGEGRADAIAKAAARPSVLAGRTIKYFSRGTFGELDLTALVNELSRQVDAVTRGNLGRAEAMLTAQAHTLDAIFAELARRSVLNLGEYREAADRYLRLAFKAQSQSRATWETLAAIKNPPTIFAKQANVTTGAQQVNNNGIPSRAREMELEPNRLLEGQHGERLDFGTSGAAIGADPAMATVGKIDRAEDAGR